MGEGEEVRTGEEAVKRQSRSGLVLDDARGERVWEGPHQEQQQTMPGLAGRQFASGTSTVQLRARAKKLHVTRQGLQYRVGRERGMLEQGGTTAGYGDKSSGEAEGTVVDSGSRSSSSSSNSGTGVGSPSGIAPPVVPCNFFSVAIRGSPLTPLTPFRQAALLYLLLLSLYWWACVLLFLTRLPEMMAVREFLEHR